jgi:hypothetical protein
MGGFKGNEKGLSVVRILTRSSYGSPTNVHAIVSLCFAYRGPTHPRPCANCVLFCITAGACLPLQLRPHVYQKALLRRLANCFGQSAVPNKQA